MYVAEKKQPKAEPFYPSKPKDKDSTVPEEKLPKKVALIKFEDNGKIKVDIVCTYLIESDMTYSSFIFKSVLVCCYIFKVQVLELNE